MENKKNLKSLRNDKRAVSPVIGVILMVAITVILAAVIGAFVFGYGAPPAAPDIHFSNARASESTDFSTIAVGSGEIADVDDLTLTYGITPAAPVTSGTITTPASGTSVSGGTVIVATTGFSVTAGDRVRVLITHTPTGTVLMDQEMIATG